MTRGVSQWIWPLYLPERSLNPKVKRACHALSLDDERTTFYPVLWTELGETLPPRDASGQRRLKDERISQVWFAGVHANVGGGYPDDALAYLPLEWIMEEAKGLGLQFKESPPADPDAFRRVLSSCDKDGRQYDSRSGLGGYYRYGPRKIANFLSTRINGSDAVVLLLPKIHESALARMRSDSNAHAPIGLPENYAVATRDGRILDGDHNSFESSVEAKARALDQEKIWNWVWLRRIVYFATLAASFHLAAFWLFHARDVEHEYSSRMRLVSETVRSIESVLPRPAHWWADWYAANPEWLVVGAAILILLIWLGSKLGSHITDSMRTIWRARARQSTLKQSWPHWLAYRIRTSAIYEWIIFGFIKQYALPFLSAIFLLWIGIMGSSHLLFNVVDSTGPYCKETPENESEFLATAGTQSKASTFETKTLCHATKVVVQRGATYAVIFKVSPETAWADGDLAASPAGFHSSSISNWGEKALMYAILPQRRVIFRPWFTVLARIGSAGVSEAFVDAEPASKDGTVFRGVIKRVERSGELFLYVNEAVVPLPGLTDLFYRNNRGSAQVVIERLS
jgi:hypothetical protein